eukprot:gene5826-5891_t
MSDKPDQPASIDFGFRQVPLEDKKPMVRAVFDSVAPKYDLMNDLMSLGIHRLWKRVFNTALAPSPRHALLDLAGGTGDISFGWLEAGGGPAILSDINPSMLAVGRDRAIARGLVDRLTFLTADAERLPLPDRSVDRVSMAFGLRNCTDKDAVLAEARRVLKPGGRFACLEFSRVQVAALRPVYDAWSFSVLPRLGQAIAGDADSYQYLAESIRMFPDQDTLAGMMRKRQEPLWRHRRHPHRLAPVSLSGKRVLLIVSGGIAAYKALELVRLLRKAGCGVTAVLTAGGAQFVTPLSLQALTESKVYTELFSLTDESEMGHIQLSRAADLVVVAPASADILAKMTHGMASDLATTLLLATDKRVLVAPAMNARMWEHPATQANMATLRARGVAVVGPDEGVMACNEYGYGRLAEPPAILAAIEAVLSNPQPLAGRHALVTSGPTHEPIDPVRYIANRSSGRQGHAIAGALAALGARVTLVSGPVTIPTPAGVTLVAVETAAEMLAACTQALPADIAVFAAAVADWRTEEATLKLKKVPGEAPRPLALVLNPDILATISQGTPRPWLVVGFAAETHDILAHAREKRLRKGCDWIVANDVGAGSDIMGGSENEVHLVTADGEESWPRLAKDAVAARLARRIADAVGSDV